MHVCSSLARLFLMWAHFLFARSLKAFYYYMSMQCQYVCVPTTIRQCFTPSSPPLVNEGGSGGGRGDKNARIILVYYLNPSQEKP